MTKGYHYIERPKKSFSSVSNKLLLKTLFLNAETQHRLQPNNQPDYLQDYSDAQHPGHEK